MIMTNNLYLVDDGSSRLNYLKAIILPFSYITKNSSVQLYKYYKVPADVLEITEQFEQWAKEVLSIAQKARKSSKPLKNWLAEFIFVSGMGRECWDYATPAN